MSFSRKALLALTGFAALAMPLAVAGSASAATNASGCTVNPLKPVYDHMNSSGQKVIKYETTVYKSVLKVLPDADSLAEGEDSEEMYHAVGFQVTSDNGVVSAWTSWENSPVVSFRL